MATTTTGASRTDEGADAGVRAPHRDDRLVVVVLAALVASVVALAFGWVRLRSPYLDAGLGEAPVAGWHDPRAAPHRWLAPLGLLAVAAAWLWWPWRRVGAAALAVLVSATLLALVATTAVGLPEGEHARAVPGPGLWLAGAAALVATVAATLLWWRLAPEGGNRPRPLLLVALGVVAIGVAGAVAWQGTTWPRSTDDDRRSGSFRVDGVLLIEVLDDGQEVPVAEVDGADYGLRVASLEDGVAVVVGFAEVFVARIEGPRARAVSVWGPSDGVRQLLGQVLQSEDGAWWVIERPASSDVALLYRLPADLGSVPAGEDGDLRSRSEQVVRFDESDAYVAAVPGGGVVAWAGRTITRVGPEGAAEVLARADGEVLCAGPLAEPPLPGSGTIWDVAGDEDGNLWVSVQGTLHLLRPDGSTYLVPDVDVGVAVAIDDGELVGAREGDDVVFEDPEAAAAEVAATVEPESCPSA